MWWLGVKYKNITENNMRPILWGTIFLCVGAVGWVISVVFVVITLGAFKISSYVFGVLFVASLPIALIFELFRFIKKKQ